MARVGDAELVLDTKGNLISLYKKGKGELLTPEQVASCVKFRRLVILEDEDGLPCAESLPYKGEPEGLKVNLFGGPTGSGKTSLINILAGGIEVEPKFESDTKCPTVYMLVINNETYAIMDTAGLCDTAAIASKDIGLQELLINSVAATIQLHGLVVVSFLMCVDVSGRLPPNFSEVWPAMQIALGGHHIELVCNFVVTKANVETLRDKKKLDKLRGSDFFQKLAHSPLGWKVIASGRGNLEEVMEVMKPITTTAAGVTADKVYTKGESLERKKQIADALERNMADLQAQRKASHVSKDELIKNMRRARLDLTQAYEELCKCGWCDDDKKRYYRSLIDQKQQELEDIEKEGFRTDSQLLDIQAKLDAFDEDFKLKMNEIRKMEGIGAFFKKLVLNSTSQAIAAYATNSKL